MKKVFIIIILILVAFLIIFLKKDKIILEDNKNSIKEDTAQKQNPEQISQEKNIEDKNEEGNSNSGIPEPESSSPPQVNTEGCIVNKISYSLGNFQEIQICNTYENENCINKEIICSADINNLDSEITGDFTLKFKFMQKETQTLLAEITQTQTIEKNSENTFSASKVFDRETANSEISCSFQILQVPSREICPN